MASWVRESRDMSGECNANRFVVAMQSKSVATLPQSVTLAASISPSERPSRGAGRERMKEKGMDIAESHESKARAMRRARALEVLYHERWTGMSVGKTHSEIKNGHRCQY